MADGQNNALSHTRKSAVIPVGAHGADEVCESTGIFLTPMKEFDVEATPGWLFDKTMRCTILANLLGTLSELMVPIRSASPPTSFSLLRRSLRLRQLLGGCWKEQCVAPSSQLG